MREYMIQTRNALPLVLTLTNLFLGMLAVIFAFEKTLLLAIILILAAALLDGLDGRVARKFNVNSDLGKQLDSLADLVSFGVAPVLLVWNLELFSLGGVGYAVTGIYPACGAYRLARFNLQEFMGGFTGIPITIAGSLLAISAFWGINYQLPFWFYPSFILFLSLLMVSKLKVPKW